MLYDGFMSIVHVKDRTATGSKRLQQQKEVDMSKVLSYYSLFHKHPVINSCYDRVIQSVFYQGLQCQIGGVVCEPKNPFATLLNTKYLETGKEMIKMLWCLGLICIRTNLKGRGDGKEPYPIVPHPGSFRLITGFENDYEQKFLFVKKSADSGKSIRVDKAVRIYTVGPDHPDSGGNIQSKIAACGETIKFYNRLKELFITAQSNIVFHPILLKHDWNQKPSEYNPLLDINEDGLAVHMRSIELTNQDESIARQQMTYLRKQRQQSNELDRVLMNDRGTTVSSKLRMNASSRMVPLPMGANAVNYNPPAPNIDLYKWKDNVEDDICMLLGIPRVILKPNVGTSTIHVNLPAGVRGTFNTTIMSIGNTVSTVLTAMYHEIYGLFDIAYILQHFLFDIMNQKEVTAEVLSEALKREKARQDLLLPVKHRREYRERKRRKRTSSQAEKINAKSLSEDQEKVPTDLLPEELDGDGGWKTFFSKGGDVDEKGFEQWLDEKTKISELDELILGKLQVAIIPALKVLIPFELILDATSKGILTYQEAILQGR